MGTLDRTKMDPAQGDTASTSEDQSDLRKLGGFQILRRLGDGGMGTVYLAYHPDVKKVALKILAEQYAENQSYIDRFYREAKSGAMLQHPNIVRTLGVGQDEPTSKHYLVLEYVDGPSALALLDRFGRLSVGDAVHIIYDIARALEHAHSRNIIHRDIKPDNILITRSGVSKLADMGLAKRTDEVSHLTATRQGFGTPHYMPYEQAINAKYADNRSDIYALGATLYHLLTGELPFPGENHLVVVEKKDIGEYRKASEINSAVPPILDGILGRMLARDPRNRYQTASELIVELERSRLSAPVPSFADPDLALQDPLVRERLVSSAQPTQPDLHEIEARDIETPTDPAPTEQVWIVRFSHKGRQRKLRMTMPQLAHRVRQKRIPVEAEVRRFEEKIFLPLCEHPELQSLISRLDLPQPQPPRRIPRSSLVLGIVATLTLLVALVLIFLAFCG